MRAMETTLIGSTGLRVSRLGLGGLFVASFATGINDAKQAVPQSGSGTASIRSSRLTPRHISFTIS